MQLKCMQSTKKARLMKYAFDIKLNLQIWLAFQIRLGKIVQTLEDQLVDLKYSLEDV